MAPLFSRRRWAGCSALVAMLVAVAPATARTPLTAVTCGQTLTHSVKLANDLSDCAGSGLVIGADAITVDLNGHMIDGTVTQAADCDTAPFEGPNGIDNTAGHDRLAIENGTVQQFATGIRTGSDTAGMSDSRLRDLAVNDNRFTGIDLGAAQSAANDNRVIDSVASGNGCGLGIVIAGGHGNYVARNHTDANATGILVCCADHNLVADNVVSHSRHEGVIVCCGDSFNTIRDNTVTDNGSAGILLCCDGDGDKHDVVAGNTIARNFEEGIRLGSASASDIRNNHISSSGDGIALGGERNTITGNDISDAAGCPGCGYGIAVSGNGSGNVVADNTIMRTQLDGISVTGPAGVLPNVGTVLRDNRVRGAARDGIAVNTELDGFVSDVVLDGNTVTGSGDDGFDVRTASTTLTDDLAAHNADLGIDAIAGVTDGGANRAFDNGNPLQCTNVLCAPW